MKKLFALLMLTCAMADAQAATVGLRWNGVVDQLSNFGAVFPATLAIGDLVTLDVYYEGSTADQNANSTYGSYPGAISSVSIDVGGGKYQLTFTPIANGNGLSTANNVCCYADEFFLNAQTQFTQDGTWYATHAEATQSGAQPGDLLSSDALPQGPFGLPAGTTAYGTFQKMTRVNGSLAGEGYLHFAVSSTSTPVPLPAAAWLLISGLGGIAAVARRKGASRATWFGTEAVVDQGARAARYSAIRNRVPGVPPKVSEQVLASAGSVSSSPGV
jgi:hypothetical protein